VAVHEHRRLRTEDIGFAAALNCMSFQQQDMYSLAAAGLGSMIDPAMDDPALYLEFSFVIYSDFYSSDL
jgi:hypothetical protein